jgi:replication factor A1
LKINEIKIGMSNVSMEGKAIAKSEPRTVRTRFGSRSVADAELEDETGTIKLSLWEQQIDLVSVGDIVKIDGAYVTEFSKQLQLNIPRSGVLEVKSKGAIEDTLEI